MSGALIGASGADRDADAHCAAANRLREEGRHADAMSEFADALLAEPRHRASLHGLAETLVALGRAEEAARVYRQALRFDPRDEAAAAALAGLAEPPAPPSPAPPTTASARAAEPRRGKPRRAFISPRHSRTEHDTVFLRRARLLGGFAFLPVVYAYVVVGLATHFLLGIAAALAVAVVLLVVGALLFRRRFWLGVRGILQGMGVGLAILALVALTSLTIAVITAASDGTLPESIFEWPTDPLPR